MSVATATITPAQLWSASPSLSPRVRRLRDQFWTFYERDYTNQVRAYSTGTPWDVVYSIWSWTNVPEVALFQKGFRSYLLASARAVALPEGFWDESLVMRQALFFREVATRHLPVQILEGELVVGSHFSTALSRCLNREEAQQRDRAEDAFLKEWHALNDVGVSLFMRGEILRKQQKCSAAKAAYQATIDQYSCAYALNQEQTAFWRVTDGARGGLNSPCP